MANTYNDNSIVLCGELEKDSLRCRNFVTKKGVRVFVNRIAVNTDNRSLIMVPIYIEQKDAMSLKEGHVVYIEGNIITLNRTTFFDNGGSCAQLNMFVVPELIETVYENLNKNEFHVSGFICKKEKLRQTMSNNSIIDFKVACDHKPSDLILTESSYYPSIAWNLNALDVNSMEISDYISGTGNFNQRKYKKLIPINDKNAYKHHVTLSGGKIIGMDTRIDGIECFVVEKDAYELEFEKLDDCDDTFDFLNK